MLTAALTAPVAATVIAIIAGLALVRHAAAADRLLDAAAVDAHHASDAASRQAAFELAPELQPHRFRTCPTCQRGDYCERGLAEWLAVPDEYARQRTALADDLARLRAAEARIVEPTQLSADAMARALGALCPLVWGGFDADHRPTGRTEAAFADELDLQAYLQLEATTHAPQPRPLSALSDSHVGVDWDGALQALLIQEATA